MIKKGDFVICAGEGDQVFKIGIIKNNNEFVGAALFRADGKLHGWELLSKLEKVSKKEIFLEKRWVLKKYYI